MPQPTLTKEDLARIMQNREMDLPQEPVARSSWAAMSPKPQPQPSVGYDRELVNSLIQRADQLGYKNSVPPSAPSPKPSSWQPVDPYQNAAEVLTNPSLRRK